MADTASKDFNPDDIYPTPADRTSNWWVFRTMIVQGTTTLLAYTPLSVKLHYDKAEALKYMQEKVAIVKPKEVKIVMGPVSREEAFNWTTLNPYVYDTPAPEPPTESKRGNGDSSGSSKPQVAKSKDDPDPYANDPNAG